MNATADSEPAHDLVSSDASGEETPVLDTIPASGPAHLSPEARAALAQVIEADDSARRRAEYSSDASNYRVPPAAVLFPRNTREVEDALRVARSFRIPITSRGAGTSVAGNAIGPGVVLDFSRHMNRILEINPVERTARVEPGVIMSDLQAAAAPFGLWFGPDPSTKNRATLGGMIGNNACGPHALAFGRTADNTLSLDVVDGRGRRFRVGSGEAELEKVPGLDALVHQNLALLRTELGRFSRQESGYSLEHLLPEKGSDLAKALVGSEGTCVTILEATVALKPVPRKPVLVVLGYSSMVTAAGDVVNLLPQEPLALEGMDSRLVDVVRRHVGEVPELPRGEGWLFCEVGEDEDGPRSAAERALDLVAASSSLDHRIVTDTAEAAALWRIRADGVGLAGRTPAGNQAWPGWEDAAVPPKNLGPYLADFEALMARYGIEGLPYGHFGDGCVHVRMDVPLNEEDDVPAFRSFMEDAARLVGRYGGSISGEHGDGRARGALLPHMYSADAIQLFEQFKGLFDPDNLLNPGILVDPAPITSALRRPFAKPIAGRGFAFTEDNGDFTAAVHRCVGVGKCRGDNFAIGGFMCPSYQATKDEKDVTRGRSRVLQDLARGAFPGGWGAEAVEEALDLCLSCKACGRDCPAGVDMSMFKSEVTYRKYKGRLRPINHYVLGWLPRWAELVTAVPGVAQVANAALSVAPLRKVVFTISGLDSRRTMTSFADQRFSRWFRRSEGGLVAQPAATSARGEPRDPDGSKNSLLPPSPQSASLPPPSPQSSGSLLGELGFAARLGLQAAGRTLAPLLPTARTRTTGGLPSRTTRGRTASLRDTRRDVLLWADSFSEYLDPAAAESMVKLLQDAGYTVRIPSSHACCGLTWISTGQLDGAKHRLTRLLDILGPAAEKGVPIIGVEPSCTAVLRSDLQELLPDDPRSALVGQMTMTLGELLTDPELGPPAQWFEQFSLEGTNIVAQPHCHQYAVMGYADDLDLLKRLGADVTAVAGCCGLAGNFGMEKGHYDISVAVAENGLLPALSEAPQGSVYLADGYSCRTQAEQLADVTGVALPTLLNAARKSV